MVADGLAVLVKGAAGRFADIAILQDLDKVALVITGGQIVAARRA